MGFDKNELEVLIDSTRLFEIDKEKSRTLYLREARKMVEYLYCYLMAMNTSKYEPYGLEIVETAKRCIENYDPAAGRFLNYFNASWKKIYGHLIGKEAISETYQGIHFTEEMERQYRKIMRYAQNTSVNVESSEFVNTIAELLGIANQEAKELQKMINCKPQSGSVISDEGEEFDILDQIDSGNYTDTDMLQLDAAKELLDVIEETFNGLQDRQKPMLAQLITSKIMPVAFEKTDIFDYFKEKAYFDENTYDESVRRGTPTQAKEIAERFGVKEASMSRSWKQFKEKIKK